MFEPAPYNLPTIYRGCIWPDIFFRWKDKNGQPFDLTNWLASVTSKNIVFPVSIDNPTNGVTVISLSLPQTQNLVLGVEAWDWRWAFYEQAYPPVLAGFVEIKEAQSPLPAVNQ